MKHFRNKIITRHNFFKQVLHSFVDKYLIPAEYWPKNDEEWQQAKSSLLNKFTEMQTVSHHKLNRLTAWKNGVSIHPFDAEYKIQPKDLDSSVALFHMGECQREIEAAASSSSVEKSDKLQIATYYLDALKINPHYSPALSALYDLTHMAHSSFTRTILYMIRLATHYKLKTKGIKERLLSMQAMSNTVKFIKNVSWIAPLKENQEIQCFEQKIDPDMKNSFSLLKIPTHQNTSKFSMYAIDQNSSALKNVVYKL